MYSRYQSSIAQTDAYPESSSGVGSNLYCVGLRFGVFV